MAQLYPPRTWRPFNILCARGNMREDMYIKSTDTEWDFWYYSVVLWNITGNELLLNRKAHFTLVADIITIEEFSNDRSSSQTINESLFLVLINL